MSYMAMPMPKMAQTPELYQSKEPAGLRRDQCAQAAWHLLI